MMLRPRQKVFVERSLAALDTHGNTLSVAPTGAGKTIMLSAVVQGRIAGTAAKAAVLAHRDELTAQNRAKFGRVAPGIATSVVDASQKSWAGQVTFAMVPTLARAANLEAMPALDLLVIDEAHHADTGSLSDFVMTEIDLLKRSSFQWCDLFGDDAALLANGFNAWAGAFFLEGDWHAVGGGKGLPTRLLAVGERLVTLAAADDWLNTHESDESAHKTERWLREGPTDRQLAFLPAERRADLSLTRYQASALLTFQFNRQAIRTLVCSARADALGRAA